MRALGAPEDAIERVRAQWEAQQDARQADLVEVYPENIPFLRALLLLADQWEWPDGFGGGRLTVALCDREVAMRVCGIAIDADNHARMAAMLGAAAKALAERRQRESARRR